MAKPYIHDYKDEILESYEELDGNITHVAKLLYHKHPEISDRCSEDGLRRTIGDALKRWLADNEIIAENVILEKKYQKSADKLRIERKTRREFYRVENAVSEFGAALVEQNKQFGQILSNSININPIKLNTGGIGVMQITDVHGNELIDLPHNKYDFNILSKRLKKYTRESLEYFKHRKVSKVLIAFTGDLLNSDRRLDELLNASTNRSKASILMIHLLKQMILEVRNEGFEVDIVSVLGNESRVGKEMTFSKEAFSDNYDFTIIAQLKQIFEFSGIEGIRFHSHDDLEIVVKVGEQNWLIKHNLDKTLDQQKNTQSSIGVQALKGILIDFVIGGHIHAHRATDISCRSGSMSGSNSFNENALGLQGRASGVCYVAIGKERYYQYIDLQFANCEGYNVIRELEAYNAKSVSKLHVGKTVMEIVI
jgi:hypothetical protein